MFLFCVLASKFDFKFIHSYCAFTSFCCSGIKLVIVHSRVLLLSPCSVGMYAFN